RVLEPNIPDDLETIILKALAKCPDDRYATARELADDMRRFVEARPIRAKRPTVLKKLTQWSRRHQGVVWTGSAGLLAAVAILAVSSFLLWQQYQQIKLTVSEKDKQFARADQQRRRAENNFGKVLSGMTEFLHGLDTNASLNEQQRAGLRQSLVHDME